MPFEITDNTTGQVLVFENKPTDADIREAFGQIQTTQLAGQADVAGLAQAEAQAGIAQPQDIDENLVIKQQASALIRPVLEAGGTAGGIILATPTGPVGQAVGAGLGFAGGSRAADIVDVLLGVKSPDTLPESLRKSITDFAFGAGGEAVALRPVAQAVRKTGIADSLVKTVLKFPKKLGVQRVDELSEAFLNRGLNITREIAKQLDSDIIKVQKQISDLIGKKTKEGFKIKTSKMIDALLEAEGTILTPRQAQDLKVGLNKAFKPDVTTKFGAVRQKVREAQRKSLRSELENIAPELKKLNPRQGIMIELRDAINSRILEIERAPSFPVKGLIAGGLASAAVGTGAGFATQSIPAGITFAITAAGAGKILSSPKVQLSIAKALNKTGASSESQRKMQEFIGRAIQASAVEVPGEEPTQRGVQAVIETGAPLPFVGEQELQRRQRLKQEIGRF
jgi:hypothetical protein